MGTLGTRVASSRMTDPSSGEPKCAKAVKFQLYSGWTGNDFHLWLSDRDNCDGDLLDSAIEVGQNRWTCMVYEDSCVISAFATLLIPSGARLPREKESGGSRVQGNENMVRSLPLMFDVNRRDVLSVSVRSPHTNMGPPANLRNRSSSSRTSHED